jgi:hypothetical protein
MSENNSGGRLPTHNVFATLEASAKPPAPGEQRPKDKWLRIGAGWENRDGSISIMLDLWPLAWSAGYRARFKLVVQAVRDENEEAPPPPDDDEGPEPGF